MEMEEERRNKHGKRKVLPFSSLTVGGEGGVTGLLVFGGALAVAGFMAVASFATQKNKAKRIHHHQPEPQQFLLDENMCKSSEDKHETTQTLSSLQHSKSQTVDVTCCWTSNKSINPVSSSELLSAQPLNLEEKIDNKPNSAEENPTSFHHQEIAFSDYSHPESAVSSNEKGFAEEKDEPQDGLTSTETDDDNDGDGDGDVDMKSDDVTETDEEDSSKAIETTTLDHKEEPVWMTVPKEASLNRETNFSVVQNDQPSILTTWVMPILFFALLSFLVLLTHGLKEYLYVLDDGDSVIVP